MNLKARKHARLAKWSRFIARRRRAEWQNAIRAIDPVLMFILWLCRGCYSNFIVNLGSYHWPVRNDFHGYFSQTREIECTVHDMIAYCKIDCLRNSSYKLQVFTRYCIPKGPQIQNIIVQLIISTKRRQKLFHQVRHVSYACRLRINSDLNFAHYGSSGLGAYSSLPCQSRTWSHGQTMPISSHVQAHGGQKKLHQKPDRDHDDEWRVLWMCNGNANVTGECITSVDCLIMSVVPGDGVASVDVIER